ncbi:MAG: antibiotic biosynthesis monooxygenase family protein [Roseobacter sp.]
MNDEQPNSGPILRLFQVRAKPGCAAELIRKFRVTSAEVVRGYPGNLGYFFGHGVDSDEDYVAFTSVWNDLEAVKARFGHTWEQSFLPPGYEDLIEEHSIRHIDVGAGWHVEIPKDT